MLVLAIMVGVLALGRAGEHENSNQAGKVGAQQVRNAVVPQLDYIDLLHGLPATPAAGWPAGGALDGADDHAPAATATPAATSTSVASDGTGTIYGYATAYGVSYQGQPLGCSGAGLYDTDNPAIAAVGPAHYAEWPCGTVLRICGDGGCAVVTRVDSCPGCSYNVVDLSEAANELVCGAPAHTCRATIERLK